jgi:hypothetical protein
MLTTSWALRKIKLGSSDEVPGPEAGVQQVLAGKSRRGRK